MANSQRSEINNRMAQLQIFKEICESSPNGIIVTNKDNTIYFFNQTAEKLTNTKTEDALGNGLRSFLPQLMTPSEDKELLPTERVVVINDKDIHVKVFHIRDEKDICSVIYLLQEFSNEFKLSLELQKSQHLTEELQDMFEGSFDGVLVTDGEGNALLVNKSYERLTAITKEELIGRNMKELINPVWMKNSVVFPVIEGKKPVSLHHTTRHGKDIIVTGTPIFDNDDKIKKVVVNVRDITEIYELREELLKVRKMESLYFKDMAEANLDKDNGKRIIVVSEMMQEIYSIAHKISNFDTTVLILGESGVGKDEIAKYIHENSLRKDKPYITINCGAIPEPLLESELFGYEKGAFTGASAEGKIGLFEAAKGGTLFLDEIGEMSLHLQVKLLRVLETREVTRVGSTKPIPVNVRVLAATNKNLEEKTDSGEFREDLFYRLNVIQIKIPPLRERVQDIAPLSLYFIHVFNHKYGQSKKLTYDVIEELESHKWTGNIRELKNVIENMVVISNNEFLQVNDLPWHSKNKSGGKKSYDIEIMSLEKATEELEKQILLKAKKIYKSTRKIAQAVEVDASTVARKLKKYGLT